MYRTFWQSWRRAMYGDRWKTWTPNHTKVRFEKFQIGCNGSWKLWSSRNWLLKFSNSDYKATSIDGWFSTLHWCVQHHDYITLGKHWQRFFKIRNHHSYVPYSCSYMRVPLAKISLGIFESLYKFGTIYFLYIYTVVNWSVICQNVYTLLQWNWFN